LGGVKMAIPMLKYLAISKNEEKKINKRKVTVTVKDWNGRPAREAEVNLCEVKKDEKLKTLAIGYTNRAGEVSFTGLAKDKSYNLKISYRGVKAEKLIAAEKEPVVEELDDYGQDNHEDDEE
jgi:hypothetical protein